MSPELTYDSALKELTVIVNDLEKDTVGVDELTVKVKRGYELLKFCKERLRNADLEITELIKGEDFELFKEN